MSDEKEATMDDLPASHLRYLPRSAVIEAVASVDSTQVVKDALLLHAKEATTLPQEAYLPWTTSNGHFARSLALPAALWGARPALGLKVINGSLGNRNRGIPRAQGLILLFDPETAHPVVAMEAAYLSALRTAAYTALTVQTLALPDAESITIVGCGAIAEAHLRLLAHTCPHAQFTLYDLVPQRARDLVSAAVRGGVVATATTNMEEAIRGALVVVTTTTTTVGYLPYEWLAAGAVVAHVSLDDVMPDVVRRADLVVIDDWSLISTDTHRLLGKMFRDGDLRGPGGESTADTAPTARQVDATLADILAGSRAGRIDDQQIVLSNPFGMGILDVALASAVASVADEREIGTVLAV
ncbi:MULTISPECIES: hypothetical protein [Nocardia]|uniref:hypothetical protein n=1 Tax=Nocardia TaxID=1817 RepID=UPI002455928E|nr:MULTISPECIES: hypothetical protein [Nocardia]